MHNRSEEIKNFAKAMTMFQAEVENATKGSVNPAFRSKYADLAEVLDTVRPVLAKHGLTVMQHPSMDDNRVAVETILMHETGEWMSSTITMPVEKATAQGTGSAITYARRYALAAVCGIAQEDDDGNAASAPTKASKAAVRQPVETVQVTEWTDEQRAAALNDILGLRDELGNAGIDEAVIEEKAKACRLAIGDPCGYDKWANRLAMTIERMTKKA